MAAAIRQTEWKKTLTTYVDVMKRAALLVQVRTASMKICALFQFRQMRDD